MNGVILTAVLSALNSGLFGASRMLMALARRHDAPPGLARLTSKGVPVPAILVSTLFGYCAVVMSYVSPDKIFYFIINSAGAVALFVYAIICGSQIRMRRSLEASAPEKLKLRMWGYPWLSWLTLALTLVVVASMLFVDSDARAQLYLSLISLAVILGVYALIRRRSGSEPRKTRP